MKYIITLIVLIALLLVGCTTSPQIIEPDTAPTNDAKTTNTATQNDVKTANPVPVPPVVVVDAAKDKFLKLIDTSLAIKYQVTYTYSFNGAGQAMSGTMKQYIDGLNKIRFDMTTSSIETQTYVVDGKMTSCTKLSGAWNCVTAESTKPDTSATISNDIKTNSADYTITTMPDRTIAGASASCFKVVSKDSTVNYCYSSDAVPLYVKTEGLANGKTVTTEMTATAYSKTVSADVFVPPKSEATTDYSDLMKKYAVPS